MFILVPYYGKLICQCVACMAETRITYKMLFAKSEGDDYVGDFGME
jgi:hypothetical protein